jgi:hypothetical protein
MKYPKLKNASIIRKLQYAESVVSEEDVSTLLNFIVLSESVNLGFSRKFLQIQISGKQNILTTAVSRSTVKLYRPKGGAWVIGTQANAGEFTCTKKYSIRSPLTQALRKLFRRENIDFYVDQASLVVKLSFDGSRQNSCKDGEILVRFFGFPIRVTSL